MTSLNKNSMSLPSFSRVPMQINPRHVVLISRFVFFGEDFQLPDTKMSIGEYLNLTLTPLK